MIRSVDDPPVTSIIFSARGLLHRRRTKVIELHGWSNADGEDAVPRFGSRSINGSRSRLRYELNLGSGRRA